MGFDVASIGEMQELFKLNCTGDRMIFANPVKVKKQLTFAKERDVKMMTFDSTEELHKIKDHFPEALAVVRIRTHNTGARYDLSEKFGAAMESIPELLKCANDLGIRVKGVSFHVGTGGVQAQAYIPCLENVKKIFEQNIELGYEPMDLVDIGGGYSFVCSAAKNQSIENNFVRVGSTLRTKIDELFPDQSIRIIAEPGTYLCESTFFLASQITGQKEVESGGRHYFVNNGVYQGYCVRLFGEDMELQPLDPEAESRDKLQSTWWGQTCDSIDWIARDVLHPAMETGEWVVTQNHGAYHKDLSSRFNGFEFPEVYYIE